MGQSMPHAYATDYPCNFKQKERAVVGSAADCEITLPSDHGMVAEKHIAITWDDESGCFVLEVLPGAKPICIDGQNVCKKRMLPGCMLKIGSQHFRFELNGLNVVQPGGSLYVKNLSLKRTGSKSDTLQKVSFEVKSGQMFGIFGPSGCGKSTLLDCLRGELNATSGRIIKSSNASVGFVHQENLLYDRLTVEENLRTSAVVRMPELDAETIEGHMVRVLNIIGLSKEDRNKPCAKLSGGMRKRVNVAVELLSMPQILLLDEPTSGLDPATQCDFMGFLKALSRRCVTVVCVTHAIETLEYFDRTIFLRKTTDEGQGPGQASMVFRGTPDELHERRNNEQVIRLFDSDNDYEEILGADGLDIENDNADMESHSDNAAQRCRPFWPASKVTFWRAWLNLWRTPLNALMVLALPVILGGLVHLSQAPTSGPNWYNEVGPILLTLIISAIWLGMNLTVREIVSEQMLCKRELSGGMEKLEYLTGKVLYASLFTAIQSGMIFITMILLSRLQPWGIGATDIVSPFARFGFWFYWGGIIALWACSFVGALVGLTISAFSKSQALAVTLLPLFLIPHLLFNRNIAGDGSQLNPPIQYCPIKILEWPQDNRDRIHLLGSAGLISRPALHVLLSSNPYTDSDKGTGKNIDAFRAWRGLEWIYLYVLIAVHMLILMLTFHWSFRSDESTCLWKCIWQRTTKQEEISCANTG